MHSDYVLETASTAVEPRQSSRYSDWLQARGPRDRRSSPGTVKNFLLSTWSRPVLGSSQPPIQWVPGTLSPRVKRQGREADHSPPTSAEVKKMWIYTSTPPYAIMAYCSMPIRILITVLIKYLWRRVLYWVGNRTAQSPVCSTRSVDLQSYCILPPEHPGDLEQRKLPHFEFQRRTQYSQPSCRDFTRYPHANSRTIP
jgi:hypothetical protein